MSPVTHDQLWVQALQEAYPQRITQTQRKNGDWALELDGAWYYWAEGRLLPEALLGEAKKYSRHAFFDYPDDEPNLQAYTPEELAETEARIVKRNTTDTPRHPGFYDALWQIHNAQTAQEKNKTTFFLGLKLLIHRELLEDLARVEESIVELSRSQRDVRTWIQSLARSDGFNWRPIIGTANRSLHSYGIALDVVPKTYGGKLGYWRWGLKSKGPWLLDAWKNRWQVPKSVVQAFEAEGFIWGGKWMQFDTIHFEYRPELLIKKTLTSRYQLK